MYENEAKVADDFNMEVWFGEWSLATDVCAMWLGGFNDGNYDVQYECEKVDCPDSYLPKEYAVDFDRTADILGPFGDGVKNASTVCIMEGKCNSDSLFFDNDDIETIARCALQSFDDYLDASFMWTAHN